MTELEQCRDRVVAFTGQYPDNVRHSLIQDNPDWQVITPALVAWGTLVDAIRTPQFEAAAHRMLRCMIEAIYVMGYQRGQVSAKLSTWTVPESEA